MVCSRAGLQHCVPLPPVRCNKQLLLYLQLIILPFELIVGDAGRGDGPLGQDSAEPESRHTVAGAVEDERVVVEHCVDEMDNFVVVGREQLYRLHRLSWQETPSRSQQTKIGLRHTVSYGGSGTLLS